MVEKTVPVGLEERTAKSGWRWWRRSILKKKDGSICTTNQSVAQDSLVDLPHVTFLIVHATGIPNTLREYA